MSHPPVHVPSTSATMTYRTIVVDGVDIFYREAGDPNAPTVVLLHGFPSSSREFSTLMPLLADRYHLVAPDYPSFGLSGVPSRGEYSYTFDHIAESIDAFFEQLSLTRFGMYLHDYGGPIGMRIAVRRPERVTSLVMQNANMYVEGLGRKWADIARFWHDRAANEQEIVGDFVSLEAAKTRHAGGSSHPDRYDPELWLQEYASLSRPEQFSIQADLLYDYQNNVASYAAWQAWLRSYRPPTLVTWGGNDASFISPGGLAFARDVPDAAIHILDAGHFALDEKVDEIATLMREFFARHLVRERD